MSWGYEEENIDNGIETPADKSTLLSAEQKQIYAKALRAYIATFKVCE